MRNPTIARNYADALLTLADRAGDARGWGRMIEQVADAFRESATLRAFLAAPQVDDAQKNAILSRAFQDRMPRLFVAFLQSLVRHRRQLLIPDIAEAYATLLDEHEGRVHAQITVAHPLSEADRDRLAGIIGERLGRTVIPHVVVDQRIMGGMIVRVGDTVLDGSVQRRLGALRRQMLAWAGRTVV